MNQPTVALLKERRDLFGLGAINISLRMERRAPGPTPLPPDALTIQRLNRSITTLWLGIVTAYSVSGHGTLW